MEYTSYRSGYATNGQAMTVAHDEKWRWDGVSNHAPTNYTIDWGKDFRYDGVGGSIELVILMPAILNPEQ
jgi:hypothetical protein